MSGKKISASDGVRAEDAPEERLVAPNPWATLSVHVAASPASQAPLEVGGLSVHRFWGLNASRAEARASCAQQAGSQRQHRYMHCRKRLLCKIPARLRDA